MRASRVAGMMPSPRRRRRWIRPEPRGRDGLRDARDAVGPALGLGQDQGRGAQVREGRLERRAGPRGRRDGEDAPSKDAWAAAHRAAINVRPAPFAKRAPYQRGRRGALSLVARRGPRSRRRHHRGTAPPPARQPRTPRVEPAAFFGEGSSISKSGGPRRRPLHFHAAAGLPKAGSPPPARRPRAFVNIMAAGGVSSSSSLS